MRQVGVGQACSNAGEQSKIRNVRRKRRGQESGTRRVPLLQRSVGMEWCGCCLGKAACRYIPIRSLPSAELPGALRMAHARSEQGGERLVSQGRTKVLCLSNSSRVEGVSSSKGTATRFQGRARARKWGRPKQQQARGAAWVSRVGRVKPGSGKQAWGGAIRHPSCQCLCCTNQIGKLWRALRPALLLSIFKAICCQAS